MARYSLLLSLVLAGCATSPPQNPDDLCAIFVEKPHWYKAARRAERKWGLPIAMGPAFIHRESSYESDAKPARGKLLWVIPWRRPSSAYGYAQATDEAWEDYRKESKAWFVERDDFADALDFIGWYNQRSHRRLGIDKTNAYHLYLAYYEGPSGYATGNWKRNATVQRYAGIVGDRFARYGSQLTRCEERLDKGWWPF